MSHHHPLCNCYGCKPEPSPVGSLRRAMHSREGRDEAERNIERGLGVWAVERRDPDYRGQFSARPATAIVFGTCRSDALRRAKTPARLCESFHATEWRIAQITSGWDTPVEWPCLTWTTS